jgi:hypothetical protein
MRFSTFMKLVIPGIAVCGCTQRETETPTDWSPARETTPLRPGSEVELSRELRKEGTDLRVDPPPEAPGPEASATPSLVLAKYEADTQVRLDGIDSRIALLEAEVPKLTKDKPTALERLHAIEAERAHIEQERMILPRNAADRDTTHADVEMNLQTLAVNVAALEDTVALESR